MPSASSTVSSSSRRSRSRRTSKSSPSYTIYDLKGRGAQPSSDTRTRKSNRTSKSKSSRRRSSSSSSSPSSAESSSSWLKRGSDVVFRVLPNAFKQCLGVLYRALRTATQATWTALTAAARTLANIIIVALKVLSAPLMLAGWVVKSVAQMGMRYIRVVLAALLLVAGFLQVTNEAQLKEWAGEGKDIQNHTSSSSRQPLTQKQRFERVRNIFNKRLFEPIRNCLTKQLPQLTYVILRVWHMILLHGASGVLAGVLSVGTMVDKILKSMGIQLALSPSTHSKGFRQTIEGDTSVDQAEKEWLSLYFITWDRLRTDSSQWLTNRIRAAPATSPTSPTSPTSATPDSPDSPDRPDSPDSPATPPTLTDLGKQLLATTPQNDTSTLTLRGASDQLVRPWKLFGTHLTSRVPVLSNWWKRTAKAADTVRQRARLPQRVTQTAEQAVTRAKTVYTSTVNKPTREQIQKLQTRYHNNAQWLYGPALHSDPNGKPVMTVRKLFSIYFQWMSGVGVLKESSEMYKRMMASRQVWTELPEETGQLVYLDAML